jgi:hypothetical protein
MNATLPASGADAADVDENEDESVEVELLMIELLDSCVMRRGCEHSIDT